MTRIHVYGDEAGNFDFSANKGASKYFILTTVRLESHDISAELLELRRDLVWAGLPLPGAFHATSDKQAVRNQVYGVLTRHDFRVDCTILEKAKAQPQTHPNELRFYKYAWYFHMRRIAPLLVAKGDELMVVAASIVTKGKHKTVTDAIDDVLVQTTKNATVTACWPAESDPCLQVADYCCWAIQRKWENGDDRSYRLIEDKIATEVDVWSWGQGRYY